MEISERRASQDYLACLFLGVDVDDVSVVLVGFIGFQVPFATGNNNNLWAPNLHAVNVNFLTGLHESYIELIYVSNLVLLQLQDWNNLSMHLRKAQIFKGLLKHLCDF